ncbi:hypothetical protein ACIHAX_26220 [Nocardia sp. NPDC051929]|uniref:hypothetical protein n=1 Tax=unclassified Nocardia TaxID=2637762 RepID=UPI003416FBA1
MDRPNDRIPAAPAAAGTWQIRFEPGITKENVERIADYAVAEGMAPADSAAFLRTGRDPRFWFSGVLDSTEVDACRQVLRKVVNNEPTADQDLAPIRGLIQRFDDWLRDLAYPREEIYDADDSFFDFD